MKKMIITLITFCILLIGCTNNNNYYAQIDSLNLNSDLKNNDILEFKIYTEEIYPLHYTDPITKQPTGYMVEVVEEIIKRIDLEAKVEILSWARAYDIALNEANVILFLTARTDAREDLFNWVGPTNIVNWSLYCKSDSPLNIETLDDAKKVNSIGTVINDGRDKLLINEGFENLERVTKVDQNIQKLMNNRIDLIASSNISINELLKKAGHENNEVKEVLIMKEVDLYIAISKGTNEKDVAKWNQALNDIIKDGSHLKIFNKYYPHSTPFPQ